MTMHEQDRCIVHGSGEIIRGARDVCGVSHTHTHTHTSDLLIEVYRLALVQYTLSHHDE